MTAHRRVGLKAVLLAAQTDARMAEVMAEQTVPQMGVQQAVCSVERSDRQMAALMVGSWADLSVVLQVAGSAPTKVARLAVCLVALMAHN